jgi:hypothetical protein
VGDDVYFDWLDKEYEIFELIWVKKQNMLL